MKAHLIPLIVSASLSAGALAGAQAIAPDAAAALARNDLRESPAGVSLTHPDHRIDFTAAGVSVHPARGPEWRWSLTRLGPDCGVPTAAAAAVPRLAQPALVAYARGPVEEQYVVRADSVEQRFVLFEEPGLGGRDLVIEGRVRSDGVLARTASGWSWSDGRGAVTLGYVSVWDARGKAVPAEMSVDAGGTRIRVDGRALAAAAYPVVVDPEIGTNDFRISDMGPDGDTDFSVERVDVAYNAAADEYLVVWAADDDTGPLGDGEFEVFGQRVDAATGAELGANDFRISDMGPDGDTNFDALSPVVAYNAARNEYLVVWEGVDDLPGLAFGESEIYGQRLDAATGAELGANDFRISDMGPDGDNFFDANKPAVAWDSTADEYLVVWSGDDDTGLLVENELEIFGQRLDGATGAEVGANDLRISDMGNDGTGTFKAFTPAVTYNATSQEYFVVWVGEDNVGGLVPGEREVFGQRIESGTGDELGTNDARLSDMGPNGTGAFFALDPDVAHDSLANQYLVVWEARDTPDSVSVAEFEVFGQLVDGVTGAELGPNDFRISEHGPPGAGPFRARRPDVAFDPVSNEFLVVWEADDDEGDLVGFEFEIYGQRIQGTTGAEVGPDDFRISDMGTDGDFFITASVPAVAYRSGAGGYLVIWSGDDDTGPLVDKEFEVYGQRLFFGPSQEVVRPGTPPNPAALLPGVTSGPVLGALWDPVIDHAAFVPAALGDMLGIAPGPANAPLPGIGTLLCDVSGGLLLFPAVPGEPFAVPVPSDCNLAGASLCAQGFSFDASGVALTNALDIVLGTP